MAKGKKDKAKKKTRPEKYEDKLAVSGSFLDVMKAAAKDADKKSEVKKS